MASRWLSCRGVRLHVVAQGQGAPVLLLHGFTGSAVTMAGVARDLSRCHRVYRLDLVGHGRSEAPGSVACYRMPACVEQVAAALDGLGESAVAVLGYSMGARVALSLALRHPVRVRSLLLVGASAGLEQPDERAARIAADGMLAQRLRGEGLAAFVDQWLSQPLFASQRRLGEAFLRAARRQRLDNDAEALALSLEGMGAGAMPPLQGLLHRIAAPALLVAGAEDEKFCGLARALAGSMPAARVAVLDGAGHAAHLEQPAAFAALALEFFARHGAGNGAGPAVPNGQSRRPGGSAVVHE